MTDEQQAEWGRLVARANRPNGTIDQPVDHELILSMDKNLQHLADLQDDINKTMVLLKARS